MQTLKLRNREFSSQRNGMNGRRRGLDGSLMQAFQFDPYDIDMNRRGKLSQKQFDRLRHTGSRKLVLPFTLALILGGTSGMVLIFVLIVGIRLETMALLCLELPAAAFAMLYVLRIWQQYNDDLFNRAPQKLSGRIHLVITQRGRKVDYAVVMQGMTLKLKREQYFSLEDRDYYSFYITPNTRHILAAEQGLGL